MSWASAYSGVPRRPSRPNPVFCPAMRTQAPLKAAGAALTSAMAASTAARFFSTSSGLALRPGMENGIGLQDDDRPAFDALRSRGEARGAEVQRLLDRLGHLAEPGAAVEADRHLAGLVELGLEPPLLELPDRPGGGVVVGVRAGLPAAEPVAGVVVPDHDPVVRRAELDDLLDDGIHGRRDRLLLGTGRDGGQDDEGDGERAERASFHERFLPESVRGRNHSLAPEALSRKRAGRGRRIATQRRGALSWPSIVMWVGRPSGPFTKKRMCPSTMSKKRVSDSG